MTTVDEFRQDVLLAVQQFDAALYKRWKAVGFVPKGNTVEEAISSTNHFLRMQLGGLDDDTIALRSVMHDDHDRQQWFELFRKRLLPSLVKFNLPH